MESETEKEEDESEVVINTSTSKVRGSKQTKERKSAAKPKRISEIPAVGQKRRRPDMKKKLKNEDDEGQDQS